jgi:hypothetical protein
MRNRHKTCATYLHGVVSQKIDLFKFNIMGIPKGNIYHIATLFDDWFRGRDIVKR